MKKTSNLKIRCTWPPIADIFQHGGGEQHRFLVDVPNGLTPEPLWVKLLNVDAVDGDLTRVRFVKPLQKGSHRRFAPAAGTDQGHDTASGDLERKVLEHLLLWPRGIREANVLELDVPEESVVGDPLSALQGNGWNQIDVLKDPRAGRNTLKSLV